MIIFKKIRYKNILSAGNQFTEIDLDRSKTTLIIGHNGAGKSTILDALCFCLYGKPFRKINKPQLVNSINNSKLVVELEFEIGTRKYKIIRGLKPAKFEIFVNGQMINQDAASRDYQQHLEDDILKMNMKSFRQIVVLGSSTFVPFMQLPAAARREVIEDLLDIQVFTTMNTLLKDKASETKRAIELSELRISNIDNQINSAELHNKSLNSVKDDQIRRVTERIDQTVRDQRVVEESLRQLDPLFEREHAKQVQVRELETQRDKFQWYVNDFNTKIASHQRKVDFFQSNDVCPTCEQKLEDHHSTQIIDCENKDIAEFREGVDKAMQMVTQTINRINALNDDLKIDQLENQRNNLILQRQVLQTTRSSLEEDLRKLQTEDRDVSQHYVDLTEIHDERQKQNCMHEDLLDQMDTIQRVARLLRDGGIKTQIIKQYIPIVNKLINKYLADLDFFVQFELDQEFNETIKSRYRDNFSYASFSEGEKMRIDIALLFTWRAVAKLRNSVATNLLIMDEIFDSSMDGGGTEEFSKILSQLSSDSNVFIISHKTDQLIDRFDDVIRFENKSNFGVRVE